ncbi:MAG: TonB-dependent receptor [Pseudoxanthomonas sp.]
MRKHVMALSIQAALISALPLVAVTSTALAQSATDTEAPVQQLETVQVTGSRIARSQVEGPAPITVITAEQIKQAGIVSVPDLLRSLNQNGGETQSEQSFTGSQTTPGAQQVDLRGLGPNHTLVLINGRRIADFPLPLRGRSNFTDIGNIPLGMIERVEVLTGSASAVYGSDAMAGVINFILKKEADGTTIDYRYGNYERGGGESHTLALTSGFSNDKFNAIFGLELKHKQPLWGYQRKIQDSREDNPDAEEREPRETFLRYDDYGYNIDPGALCDNVSQLNDGTTGRYEDEYGFYCGSQKWIGYGTIESERESANAYASFNYTINDKLSWFADVQLGYGKVGVLGAPLDWRFQDPDAYRGDRGYFRNADSGHVEYWTRRFAPEESGGLDNAMTRTTQKTLGIATGFKGTLGEDWDFEALLNHSQYNAEVRFPRVIAAAANQQFLGDAMGYDDYGYGIYEPDPNNFYRALTRAEYDAITATSVFKPKARSDTASFTVSNTDLFSLPAGPVGFAGTVEYGTQSYHINPDPLALTPYYYGARYGDGNGDRSHWGLGGELRAPVLDSLTVSAAGRYDKYSYGDVDPGKFTYNLGLEWRPLDSLLVRGSYGTGFRAPDLHYLFAGRDFFRSTHRDYYNCRLEEGDAAPDGDCRRGLRQAGGRDEREGNQNLDYETSKSFSAGFVWSPSANFDLSLDYFDIKIANQIEDQSPDKILQDEANCLIGNDVQGNAIDPNSPTCLDAVPRAIRDEDGVLLGVFFQPVNISQQSTSGYDFSAHYRLETGLGIFGFRMGYTYFDTHDSKQFAGDGTIDHFAINSGYDIPRTKANATISWEKNNWGASLHGQRLGRLPTSDSYDEVWQEGDASPWVGATYRYNGSVQYRFNDNLKFSLSVDNLFDKMPPKDNTYTSYPYYDISWFDSVGRSYYFNITYQFGGSAN